MTNEKTKGRNLPIIINLNNNEMTKGTKVVLTQNGQPKIQADNVAELVSALYKGLKVQSKIGKRFLKLGATTEVVIPTKNTKYLQLQKLSAKGFSEAQMLEVINYLNS